MVAIRPANLSEHWKLMYKVEGFLASKCNLNSSLTPQGMTVKGTASCVGSSEVEVIISMEKLILGEI